VRYSDFRCITPNFELVRPKLTITSDSRMIRTPNSKGFTLIETIITLVVLSIAAVGVLSVFTTGIKGSSNPLIIDQAVQLAQEKMDDAIALRKSGGFAVVTTINPGLPAFPAPFNTYTWSRVVDCDPNPTFTPCPAQYQRVTISVSWNAGADSVSLVTLIANY
jgi:prepilin-type N-terminal cleavage/methylation domain-containing protein